MLLDKLVKYNQYFKIQLNDVSFTITAPFNKETDTLEAYELGENDTIIIKIKSINGSKVTNYKTTQALPEWFNGELVEPIYTQDSIMFIFIDEISVSERSFAYEKINELQQDLEFLEDSVDKFFVKPNVDSFNDFKDCVNELKSDLSALESNLTGNIIPDEEEQPKKQKSLRRRLKRSKNWHLDDKGRFTKELK